MQDNNIIEYIPYFKSTPIKKPSIIGAVIDYSPLFTILNANIFVFCIDNHEIPSRLICDYFDMFQHNLIRIKGYILYNNKELKIEMAINGEIFHAMDDIHFSLHSILTDMIFRLKNEMFKLHEMKEQLDILNTKLTSLYQSNKTDNIYIIRDMIDNSMNEIDLEFDRRLFMKKNNNNICDMSKTMDALTELDNMINFDEFEKIDNALNHASKTLKLDLSAIRRLPKEKSNKFVLPLYESNPGDIERFNKLVEQPFSFLSYNNAMFSVNLYNAIHTDNYSWQNLWDVHHDTYTNTINKIHDKEKEINDRCIKINNIYNKLGDQIILMKESFVHRANKYKNPKMLRFIASRTETNINTIRVAEKLAKRKIEILSNKKLTSDPKSFFNRAVKLYLGKTGDDIINDFKVLNIVTNNDYCRSIEYLYFLMHMLESRSNKYIAPILPIIKDSVHPDGYKLSKILKVLAGHMFIHTISLSHNTKKSVKKSNDFLPEDIEGY